MHKMKNNVTSPKVLAISATVLLFASLLWLGSVYQTNGRLEQGINEERLKSEANLSEKLALEKQIDKLKKEIGQYAGKNEEIDRQLAAANARLDQQSAEMRKARSDEAAYKEMKKQYSDLLQLKQSLEQQVAQLNGTVNQLQSQNKDLSGQVAVLQQKNNDLTDQLNTMSLAVNESRVEAIKKSNKLTVSARKTKKLIASFDLPSKGMGNLEFRITNPSGKVITTDGTIVSKVVEHTDDFTASLASMPNSNVRHIEMTFESKNKLESGVYTIEVLNNNLSSGTIQVKLR